MISRECIQSCKMIKIILKWKVFIFWFFFILFCSFGLRVLRIYFDKQPIFGDEAIYIHWSQMMRSEPSLRFVPLSDGKQPLFMWITIPFLKIFNDPLFAGRILSAICGLISTGGIMILSLLLFESVKASLVSGLIYAISPFTVFFDSMALSDSMLSMFGVLFILFTIITIKKVRLDTAILAGFCLGGALLTKSPALIFVLFLPLTLFIYNWPKKFKDKFYDLSVFVFLFTFTISIAYGFYNILRLGPNFHMISIRNKDYVYPLNHLVESFFDPLLPFLSRIWEYFWIMGPSFIVLLFLAGLYWGFKKFRRETLVLVALGFIPIFVVAEFSKILTARYIYFSIPYLFILTSLFFYPFDPINKFVFTKKGRGLNLFNPSGYLGLNLSGRFGNLFGKKIYFLSFLTFFIFIFHSLYIDYLLITEPQSANLPRSERSGYFEEWTSGYGIKEISMYLRNLYENKPNEKIVVGTEGYFGTLPDGLQIYLNDLPEITVVGVGQPIREIPKPLIESKVSGNKTYLVVNSSRLLLNLDNPKIKLIEKFPKALMPDNTREELYLIEIIGS